MTYNFYKPVLRDQRIKTQVIPNNCDFRDGIVVRSSNWLGDCLMTLPAIFQFRKMLPENGKLSIVCRKSVAGFWQSIQWIDNVIVLEGKYAKSNDRKNIRALNAGIGVIIPNSFASAYDLWNCGIPIRLGRAGRWRSIFLTHTIPEWEKINGKSTYHQVANYLDLAIALGIQEWTTDYEPIKLPNVANICEKLGMTEELRPWLVLAPGAAYGPAKQWPIDYYTEVAQDWTNKGGSVIVTGTSNDIEAGEQIIRQITPKTRALNLAGKTSLSELMSILQNSDKLLVNDSGAMHLAAALGKTGVAVFGSTDDIATGPLGGKWLAIHHHLPCAPCFKRQCPRTENQYECLLDIKPTEVIDALGILEDL